MAVAEDAASVLEQFVQDVANLPAEIAHLLEEVQAKDRDIGQCHTLITTRDSSIQRWLKQNGAGQANPKEEQYAKTILSAFDKAQIIQEEKVGLADKAGVLLDRQIKRLDLEIRKLQNEGVLAIDPQLPSLLHQTLGNRIPPTISTSTTGASTPLHPIPGNAGPSTTIANSALARLVQPQTSSQRLQSSSALSSLNPLHPANASSQFSAQATPASTIHLHHRVRESSLGAVDPNKRRRLNTHLNIPTPSSGLRQSSLGPGTPKTGAGTPVSARGGSAGPRAGLKKPGKKVAPHQRVGHLNPNSNKKSSSSSASRRRPGKKFSGLGMKPSPSDTGEDSALSEVDGSESELQSQAAQGEVEMEDVGAGGEEEEEQGDDRKYCTCQSVSYGNMVACDNDECPYEWFHWSCVGMTKEPAGKWFCEECRSRLNI